MIWVESDLVGYRRVLWSQCYRIRNGLYCVGWGVKLYSLTHSSTVLGLCPVLYL